MAEVVLGATQAQRLALALSAARLGTFQWDMTTGVTTWDDRLEAIFGLPPGGFDGTFETWVQLLHPDDRGHVLETVERAVGARSTYEVKHRVVWPDGTVRWVEGRGQVTVDADGAVTGTIGCSVDVTDRVVAEQAAAAAAWRTALLQDTTAALASAVTVEQVVAAISTHAELALQAKTGAVYVQVGDALRLEGSFGYPVAIEEYAAVPVSADLPVPEAFRTGRTIALTSAAFDERYPELAALRRTIAGEAVVCAPLLSDGRPIGVLALTYSGDRVHDDEDVMHVETLASQCALALARARLLTRSREVAEQLQAELTPRPLPHVPGVELAAHYRPGGEEIERVGGDWYDVFAVDDRRIVLVVGDVMGRGVAASASMTRVRSALRAYSVDDPAPAAVLGKADRLLARDGRGDEIVTATLGLYDVPTGQLVLASAGHPPPVLAGRGLVEVEPGLPLGLGASHVETQVVLRPGDSLVLFTDGLVERRGGDLERDLLALARRVDEVAGLPLAVMVERLAATAEAGDDDVTLLALRRPPEPGAR